METWFSEEERAEIATPVIKRLRRAIREGDTGRAIALCDELRDERILLHDFFADSTTALFTWVGENLGEEALPAMFKYCFEKSAQRQILDLMNMDMNRGLEAELLVRGCWVAHSCSGAGEHPGAFRLEEDDEKFTFIMDPCGSGGRLWRKGAYGPPRDLAVTSRAYPWSFNCAGLPYYCVHCTFLNESMPMCYLGFPTWPVDPPASAGDECRWYIYKDKWAVPARYYDRYGLAKKKEAEKPTGSAQRWFTPQQMEDIVRPTPVRIRERLERGDTKGALRIARVMAGEFFFLHSLYVGMVVSVLDFIAMRAGEEKLGEALAFLYEKCIAEQIVSLAGGLDRREALLFIIHNFFLADVSGGAGFPPAGFSVSEDTNSVTVILDPCGSGGELIRHNSYKPLGAMKRALESVENKAMGLTVRLPLPRGLLQFAMPYTIDFLCEMRRSAGMGTTTRAYHWSGGRAGMPYYCCLCTAFLEAAGAGWLQVHPPEGRRQPCVWRAAKSG
jgi:hypothetical protein